MGYNIVGLSANLLVGSNTGFDNDFNLFSNFPFGIEQFTIIQEEYNNVVEAKNFSMDVNFILKNFIRQHKLNKLIQYYSVYRKLKKRMNEAKYPYLKSSKRMVDHIINSSYEEPIFMFLNFMEVHEPVTPWDVRNGIYEWLSDYYDSSKMEKIKKGYIKALEMLDSQLGRFFKFLKESKIYDDSLIIVLSDHGQAMKERRKIPYYGQEKFFYDNII